MKFLLSFTPIVCLVFTLFFLRWPLKKAAPVTFFYTLILTWFMWDLALPVISALIFKSALLTFDVILILFGAILFLGYLRTSGLIAPMQARLSEISHEKSTQTFLLAWLFGSFLEGISGFGTPAAIVAPLLVGLGFPALKAILLSLLANSTAVTFGAVGTPIRVGLASWDTSGVAGQAALINLLSGWLVPVMMLAVISDNLQQFKNGIPRALAAGLLFLIPYYVISQWSYEFPSVFGGAIGLTVATLYLKPKQITLYSLVSAFSPYIYLIGFLVVGKYIFMDFSSVLSLAPGLTHTLNLFNPGFAFLTVIMLMNVKTRIDLRPVIFSSTHSLKNAFIGIFFTSALSYLMIMSGLLNSLSHMIVSSLLPFIAAALGAFGSFLAGSATVSNLLFSEAQALAADEVGVSVTLILALQLVGAGVGNMIALGNIIAVQATVGVAGQEAYFLKRLIVPCGIYLLLVGVLGMLFS